jgi:hypothetical protein
MEIHNTRERTVAAAPWTGLVGVPLIARRCCGNMLNKRCSAEVRGH